MSDIQDKIQRIEELLRLLESDKSLMAKHLEEVSSELARLQDSINSSTVTSEQMEEVSQIKEPEITVDSAAEEGSMAPPPIPNFASTPPPIPKKKLERSSKKIEAFIGSNLLGKIGILVTIIGVFIGIRYAIEYNLIGPLMRIIIGYAIGAGLAILAFKLKKKYLNYSAVLLGGGLAVGYFITYLAHSDSYGLLPQIPAFIIMLLITIFAVFQALSYDKVVIAHIGLVAAYAIPFLVSNNTSNYLVFLIYITIINWGILYLSLRRYWKSLFYAAFFITWVIYAVWFFKDGSIVFGSNLFVEAFVFLLIFFFTFYATFLLYKIKNNDSFKAVDTTILISNALVMGVFCYILFNNVDTKYLGIVALSNALIHAGVFTLVRSFSPADKSIYYITLGLAITFVTIAIPMEVKSNWAILFWAMEALIIFYIGYRKKDTTFQAIAACIALLTIVLWSTSKFSGWYYPNETLPFWNISFFNNLITMVALSCIPILFQRQDSNIKKANFSNAILGWIIPIFVILGGWYTFDREILNIHHYTNAESYDYLSLGRMLWSVFYVFGIAWFNKVFFKNEVLKQLATISILVGVLICLTYGIELLENLCLLIVSGSGSWFYFVLRYITIAYTGLAMYFYYQNNPWFTRKNKAADIPMLLCYLVGLIWLSNEYFQWINIGGYGLQSRFGLSIVWACYAVLLVIQGIRYKERYLRIAAIVLAGVTMLKLVFFDLINTTMLTKTVVFIVLGILLLVMAYLYNRYKDIIEGEGIDDEKEIDKPTSIE